MYKNIMRINNHYRVRNIRQVHDDVCVCSCLLLACDTFSFSFFFFLHKKVVEQFPLSLFSFCFLLKVKDDRPSSLTCNLFLFLSNLKLKYPLVKSTYSIYYENSVFFNFFLLSFVASCARIQRTEKETKEGKCLFQKRVV